MLGHRIPADPEVLVQDYISAAKRHGEATDSGDYKAANKSYFKLITALHGLDGLDSEGRRRLTCTFNQSDPHVRVWGATHLLRLFTDRCVAVLEEVASGKGIVSFNAEMVLREWRKGTLKIP